MTVANHGTNRSGGKQPISQHPLFPAIVALWFGAAFGIGSLLMSPALAERLVMATGIGKVLSMAAPPLGGTARVLIALALTGLGAVIGVGLARRISRPAAVLRTRRRDPAADSAPYFAEGFGDVGPVEAPAPEAVQGEVQEAEATPATERVRSVFPGRRRGLTAQENPPPVDVTEPQILDVAELDLADFDAEPLVLQQAEPVEQAEIHAHSPSVAGDGQAFGLGDSSPFMPQASDVIVEAMSVETGPVETGPQYEDAWSAPENRISEPAPVEAAFIQTDPLPETTEVSSGKGAERIAGAELDELSPVELLERLAIAMERSRELRRTAATNTPTPVEEPAFAAPPVGTFAPLAPVASFAPYPVAPVAAAEPEAQTDLSSDAPSSAAPAPLAFARLTLQPLAFDAPVEDAPVGQETPENEDPTFAAPVSEVAEPVSQVAPFAPPPRIPAALRPVSLDDFEDDEDDALPGYIPPRHIGLDPDPAPQPQPLASLDQHGYEPEYVSEYTGFADEEDGEEEALEQGYSSLLNLSRPSAARTPFVRIDEPEEELPPESAVVFPGSQDVHRGPFSAPSPLAPTGGATPVAPRLFDAPGRGDARDTEKALRAALATLQRMSGAA